MRYSHLLIRIRNFFVPSQGNGFLPHALRVRSLAYCTIVTAVLLLAFSPLTDTMPYRVFLAALSEQLILSQVNPERTNASVSPLRVNPALSEAARLKAEDMIARDYFAHIGPQGELPWTWLTRMGYRYAAAGENLAKDFSDPNALVRAWIASPAHRANIQNGLFTDVGIGIANGSLGDYDTTVVVMFLGKQATSAPVPATSAAIPPLPPPAPLPPAQTPKPTPPSPPQPAPSPSPQHTPQPSPPPAPQEPVPSSPAITAVQPVPPEEPLIVTISAHAANELPAIPPPETKISDGALRVNALSLLFTQMPKLLRALLTVFLGTALAGALGVMFANARIRAALLPRTALFTLLLGALWLS